MKLANLEVPSAGTDRGRRFVVPPLLDEWGASREPGARRPTHVRRPGFIVDELKGLGEVIKHSTRSLEIKLCGDCEARAKTLNLWAVFLVCTRW